MNTCQILDCDKPLRSPGATWCAMHYHRWYRHGDPLKVATGKRTNTGAGQYVKIYAPNHPLARGGMTAYEHRVVLYDATGPGEHPCHWCHTPVRWEAHKGEPDILQVDHLNGRKDDNKLENLVPSCLTCNTARGAHQRSDRLRAAGWWSRKDTIADLRNPEQQRRPRVA